RGLVNSLCRFSVPLSRTGQFAASAQHSRNGQDDGCRRRLTEAQIALFRGITAHGGPPMPFQEAIGAISVRNARKAPTRTLSRRVHQPRRVFARSARILQQAKTPKNRGLLRDMESALARTRKSPRGRAAC